MKLSSGSKIAIAILSILLVIFFAIFILVQSVYTPEEVPLVYPTGNLSDSLFTAQNNEYTKNDSLIQTHEFSNVPFLADVPAGQGIEQGTGTVYKASSNYLVYVSEYPDVSAAQNIVASQFPGAVLSSYIPENTQVTAMVDRTGYINGFTAEYIADRIRVTDGANIVECAIFGYALDVASFKNINEAYAGYNLFVGVGTNNLTQESFDGCAQILDAVMNAVRYDEDTDRAMTKAREKEAEEALKQQALAEEEAEGETARSDEEEYMDNSSAAEGSTVELLTDDVQTMYIEVTDDYEMLNVVVTWTGNNPYAICELFLPDGQSYCDPVEQTAYDASFVLTNGKAGTYKLNIKYASYCGTIGLPAANIVVADDSSDSSSQ